LKLPHALIISVGVGSVLAYFGFSVPGERFFWIAIIAISNAVAHFIPKNKRSDISLYKSPLPIGLSVIFSIGVYILHPEGSLSTSLIVLVLAYLFFAPALYSIKSARDLLTQKFTG
jgi:hypothetical protein